MALVTFAGYPCSGKSTRARQLQQFLETKLSLPSTSTSVKRLKIVLVNDETLGLDKSVYDDGRREKPARASLFSAVQRHCSRDTIVIVDAMNYIKGSRYQMYCQAREIGVWVAAPPKQCQQWNSERPQGQAYNEATLENLISRFEEPNSSARWDSPLITIASFDPDLCQRPSMAINDDDVGSNEAEKIWEAITTGDIKPPNVAVLPVLTASTSYLTQLETLTSNVISALLARQSLTPLQGTIPLTIQPSSGGNLNSSTIKIELTINKNVSMPLLQRLKKQFTKLNQQTGKELNQQQMVMLFAEYLQGQLS
ncbi:kti12, chromatin associated [Microbotryomycetes sp. JL221]|nr:kti12, chromatin associated [Microbotryomycetes sp. JL221]